MLGDRGVLNKTRAFNTVKSLFTVKEIRCRANLMPFRSLLYATSFAMLKAPKRNGARTAPAIAMLSDSMKVLNIHATRLYEHSDPDPYSMADALKNGIGAYVDLFYAMNPEQVRNYMNVVGKSKFRIRINNNLLYIPAMMSEIGEDAKIVKDALYNHIYAMPFKMLYSSSRAALSILLLERGMAVSEVSYDSINRFSAYVASMDARIQEISNGKINPISDEELKSEFISHAVSISEETDINVAEIISQKVRTDRHVMSELGGLVRKASADRIRHQPRRK